jgi:AcrR family transcriptional regulator
MTSYSLVTMATRMAAPARRSLLLATAGPIFAREGYAGARLDDIAAAAHVTKPIVYRHFESKKALYLALLEKHEADLPTFFDRVAGVAGELEPDDLARAILEHWLEYVRENQHSWVMLFRDHSGDEEIRAKRLEVSTRAREVMAAFIAARAGERIPAEQVAPTAELLVSGLAGMALWWIDHPDVPKDVLMDVAARISAPAIGGQ